MSADTLLLVCPPDDPLGLLVDSVGGGKVPVRQFDGTRWIDDDSAEYQGCALVLQLDGVPDRNGWNRIRTVIGAAMGLDPQGGIIFTCTRYGGKGPWAWVLSDWNGMETPILTGSEWGPGQMRQALADVLKLIAPTYRLTTLAADGREKGS